MFIIGSMAFSFSSWPRVNSNFQNMIGEEMKMSYSVSEVAKMMNVSTYTIRYYDKEGLFPMVKESTAFACSRTKTSPG